VIELDSHAAAVVPYREVGVQAAVLDAKVIEVAQRLTGEVAKLRMMPLGLKLCDDNDRQHHAVLGKSADGCRIRQQDAGVEDVRAARRAAADGGSRRSPGSDWPGGLTGLI
jgi:hypothetical protein